MWFIAGTPFWSDGGQALKNVSSGNQISVSRITTGMYDVCERSYYDISVKYDYSI
jgi:hypothetical protein